MTMMICGEALLDSYSPERSGVGDEVLKNTSRLTAIGTLHNPVAEELRNLVGRFALGFAPVQQAVVDNIDHPHIRQLRGELILERLNRHRTGMHYDYRGHLD